MARANGNQADFEKYVGRSGNWKNVFNPDQPGTVNGTDTGFVGFVQPKNLNGTWNFQDPGACSPIDDPNGCYLNPTGQETYEGSPWLYTFFVPHDMAALITAVGGPSAFVNRLDYYHDSGIAYIGDEQAFLNVFLYRYAGRPGRTAYRAHFYIPSNFNSSACGIPGNDDSGAMGAFSFLTMLGLFPNPGQDVYFILPPFFESITVTSKATGTNATIRNVNFDPSYQNIYIQFATLNGQSYTKNWIDHSFFLNGGVLELTLGANESDWGTRPEDLPPSLSTGYWGSGNGNGTNGTAILLH
jgi:putative alpha-1,2-mannosidase